MKTGSALRLVVLAGIMHLSFVQGVLADSGSVVLQPERRVEAILHQLTLEEKIELLGARFRQGFPEKGIRPISLADGPMGFNRNIGKATPAYPATQLLAATFDPGLAEEYADSLAVDWLIGGADVFLAPGLNVQRIPVNGRNAEYFGEDPFLIAAMVRPVIRTIQSHGIMAVAKHFIANNQDYNRYRSNSIIAERPLQEIYFPGFKAAVEAGVGGLMAGHNRFNGMYCVESDYLGPVLRDDWNFDGLFISDWNGRHDAEKAFRAELDVDAPEGRQINIKSIRPLVEAHPELNFSGNPLFPFGYGLSYTSFEYSDMQVRPAGEEVVVRLNVTNTGSVRGREVVQLYVADPESSVPRPPKELKGFAGIELAPGETRPVEIRLKREAFCFFHPEKKKWIQEPGRVKLMAGASSRDIRLAAWFREEK